MDNRIIILLRVGILSSKIGQNIFKIESQKSWYRVPALSAMSILALRSLAQKIGHPHTMYTYFFYKNNFKKHEAHFSSKFKNKLRTIQP